MADYRAPKLRSNPQHDSPTSRLFKQLCVASLTYVDALGN